MTTLIVSDVHLGSSFNKAKELSAFLRSVSFSRLIILGDLFDKSHAVRLREDEWDFLDLIRGLTRQSEIIWVEGNHDEGLYDTIPSLLNIEAVKELEWGVNGKRFLAIHGHQFDQYCRENNFLPSCAGWLYRSLRRIDIMTERDIFHDLCFENNSWKRSSGIVSDGAIEYAKNKGADFVFCGHTHRADNIKDSGIEYFNTGCWSDRHCHYVTVDNHGVSLRKFSEFGEVAKAGMQLTAQQAI